MNKLTVLFSFLITVGMVAQTKQAGPVFEKFGEVWSVDDPSYKTDISKEFRVVFDIMNSPESHSEINKSIETAARFLNMHVRAGIPKEQLKVALVVHNQATKDIITDMAYRKRFGTDNPNSELIRNLLDADVSVILCGQSSLSRNFPIEESIDGVELALSAMTAILQLQDEGYKLIKF